ncbi:MAG TPA: helix-turn-helix domain-containing protein [Kofleriaceae bacterium]|jgi:AraC-like DNA-binding protein
MRGAYREYVSHPALRPFVDRYWTRSGPSLGGGAVHVLPDGCTDILIDLRGGRSPRFVGAMTSALTFTPDEEVRALGIRFRPGGARAFLRVEIAALTDGDVALTDLGVRDLLPELLEESVERTLGRIERALLSRLPIISVHDRRIRHAVRCLVSQRSITSLSHDLAWSRQHLRRAVVAATGLAPKQLASVARMMQAATYLQREPRRALSDIAVTTGYFDQAHMTAELGRLALASPRKVRESIGSIFPIPSLFEEA